MVKLLTTWVQCIKPKVSPFNYGALAIPMAMLGLPVYIYLPNFYQQHFSMSLSVIGSALLAARLLDVVTDPIVGSFSDHISRYISRKKQVALASLLLCFFLFILFMPSRMFNHLTMDWLTLFTISFLTYLSWTMVQIPYLALAAETRTLVNDNLPTKTSLPVKKISNNRYVAFREVLTIFGVLVVVILPFASDLAVNVPEFYEMFYVLFCVVLLLSLILLSLSEAGHHIQHKAKSKYPFHKLRLFKKNPIAEIFQLKQQSPQVFTILKPYFINNLATAVPATLFIIFVDKYLMLAGQTGLFLLVYFLAGIIALPIWLRLVKFYDLLSIWRISILISIVSFILALFLEAESAQLYFIICLLTGLSVVIDIVIPANIQTEMSKRVSDINQNQNGLVFGLWGITTKLSLAVAVGLSLPAIDFMIVLGFKDSTALLFLYVIPAVVLKLWVWFELKKFNKMCF